jgi:hypothetical protein
MFLDVTHYWSKEAICLRRFQIKSSASLVGNFSWNQTSITYINSSIKLNFIQSAYAYETSRCVLWIYVMLFQRTDTFHKEFVPSYYLFVVSILHTLSQIREYSRHISDILPRFPHFTKVFDDHNCSSWLTFFGLSTCPRYFYLPLWG